MKMVLHTKELGFFDVRVEQRDGVGLKVALFLSVIFVSIQCVVESISLLVKLHGFIWVDLLVVEFESCVLEIWVDYSTSFQIDWGLIRAKTFPFMKIIRVVSVGIFRSILEPLKKEWHSWSFRSWIFVRFRIIVLELMMMFVLAVWGAEKWSNRLPWVSLHSFDLVLNFVILSLYLLLGLKFSPWHNDACLIFVFDVHIEW